jgi:flagellar biosynthesis/type III secretory pathway M-ring protein FliF/YscJ
VAKSLLDAIRAGAAVCMIGTICGGAGLVSTSPGKKNIRGEKLWVVAMPLQPVQRPGTTAASARHFIMEPTLTPSIIVMIRILANFILRPNFRWIFGRESAKNNGAQAAP